MPYEELKEQKRVIHILEEIVRRIKKGMIDSTEPELKPGTTDKVRTRIYTETIIDQDYKITIDEL